MNNNTIGVEEWRPIPGYEGSYEVSDQGNVRSLDRLSSSGKRLKGGPLKLRENTNGYMQVVLSHGGVKKASLVHRLVLTVFVGPPEEGMQACHGNNDPGDNRLENLRWGTPSENNREKTKHGVHPEANKTRCPRGHPLVDPNLVASAKKRGHRNCRACGWARNRIRKFPELKGNLQEVSDSCYEEIRKEVIIS